jgi:hypothetical protein
VAGRPEGNSTPRNDVEGKKMTYICVQKKIICISEDEEDR